MLSSIYHKLYFSFLGIFAVTVIIVLALSSHFYGNTLRAGMEDAYLSQARFFRSQYVEACGAGGSFPTSVDECENFLERAGRIRQLRFWVLDPDGDVVASSEKQPPEISAEEMERAGAGEEVGNFARRGLPRAVLPITDSNGRVREVLIVERSLWHFGGRPPRFPFIFSLLIAGVVAALLVLPLSLRITRPVRELHRMGQEWAEGRLEKRANVSGKDEISQLAGVFNGMADNLQRMIQQRKEFLALISHEMKSPLTRLGIALEMLSERSSVDPDVARLVKGMKEDIEDSENLIEQLLILSRLEMLDAAGARTSVDLKDLLHQVLQLAGPVADAGGVQVTLQDFVEGEARLIADGEQLRRAFSNVLDNAVKFSPKGSEVQVLLSRSGGGVRIEVADRGEGIDPEDLERVFEPFYRGRSRESKRGSGLGLYIAKRIIQSAGGSISARPNQPAGTVIAMDLK
jgi:two-component system OmpR family sensor kinase